ncbi:MAG: VCBS repeat-containing protein, partial [Thermoguttaceae bacterium]|nr:VCBS repeat-containing protein [Thermoguttaceae bacterium]
MRNCPFVCGRLIAIGLAVAMVSPTNEAADAASPIVFADVTAQTGITFRHTDGGSGRRYIQETVTAGLALFDYDSDGDVDIYFINAAPLDGTRFDVPPQNALYRNDGDWRFTDVTAAAGVGDTGYGLGVAVADYDNDGDQDIFVNNFGPDVLYRNNGDGTFSDITRSAGTVGDPDKVGAGACFLDGDGDGDLDLYASGYLDFTYTTHIHNTWMGHHVYPGPDHYHPVASTYYRNNGDDTFSDDSQASGIGQSRGRGMGTVCADYDQDGDTDLFVANDSAPNF